MKSNNQQQEGRQSSTETKPDRETVGVYGPSASFPGPVPDQYSGVDQTCPECDGSVVKQDIDFVCTDCGLIVETDSVSRKKAWHNYSNIPEENNQQTASLHPGLHDRGLGESNIGYESELRGLSAEKRRRLARQRRYNHRKSKKERNQVYGFTEVKRMCTALSLKRDCQQLALQTFRQAHEEELSVGRSLEAIASASVYIAARILRVTRTFDEVTRVSRLTDKTRITNAYKTVRRELSIKVPVEQPAELVPRCADEAGVSKRTEQYALEIVEEIQEGNGVGIGTSPQAIAGAEVYLAGTSVGSRPTLETVADAAGVCVVTLTNVSRQVRDELSLDIPLTGDDPHKHVERFAETCEYEFSDDTVAEARKCLDKHSDLIPDRTHPHSPIAAALLLATDTAAEEAVERISEDIVVTDKTVLKWKSRFQSST